MLLLFFLYGCIDLSTLPASQGQGLKVIFNLIKYTTVKLFVKAKFPVRFGLLLRLLRQEGITDCDTNGLEV